MEFSKASLIRAMKWWGQTQCPEEHHRRGSPIQREDLPFRESRAILNTLTPGLNEVSNPRDDLSPHTKITQLLDSKSMVDAIESLGKVRNYQRTNSIRFISTFVEHIKKLYQTVCSWGAFNAPIMITIKRTCDIFKDPPRDKPFTDLYQKSS